MRSELVSNDNDDEDCDDNEDEDDTGVDILVWWNEWRKKYFA